MDKIKYIFFDWGYTLAGSFKNTDSEIKEILDKYNLSWKNVFKYWKNYQLLLSLGKINEEQVYNDLSRLLEISKEDLEKIDKILLESHIIDDDTIETIKTLKEKGYYLGIISNNSQNNVDYILERDDLAKYFDKVIVSETIKERKPNLKVYLTAFEDIPEEDYSKILFVSDEFIEDLVAVKILGVKTAWLRSKVDNEWKKEEKEILLKPDIIISAVKELLDAKI
ncbi:MAG: HAD family hydrolase [Christensenellaceae bacterium]|jgi:HAD superfamily hydrolase (TIGR01549 family)|nr:HAD family hydrolase [Christensenellaceae bacterium]